jgi:hypothetical protein
MKISFTDTKQKPDESIYLFKIYISFKHNKSFETFFKFKRRSDFLMIQSFIPLLNLGSKNLDKYCYNIFIKKNFISFKDFLTKCNYSKIILNLNNENELIREFAREFFQLIRFEQKYVVKDKI